MTGIWQSFSGLFSSLSCFLEQNIINKLPENKVKSNKFDVSWVSERFHHCHSSFYLAGSRPTCAPTCGAVWRSFAGSHSRGSNSWHYWVITFILIWLSPLQHTAQGIKAQWRTRLTNITSHSTLSALTKINDLIILRLPQSATLASAAKVITRFWCGHGQHGCS